MYVSVELMQRYQFSQHQQIIVKIDGSTVLNAQCNIGSEKHPDVEMTFTYAVELFSQTFGEIFTCFRQVARDKN